MDANTNKNEKDSRKVSEWWKYGTIVSTVMFILIFIGKDSPQVDFKWVILTLVGIIGYQKYREYVLQQKQPSLDKLVGLVKKEGVKQGKSYNLSWDNILCEPLGKEQWALRVLDIKKTFLIERGVVYGISIKNILELQLDSDKSEIKRILAQKGQMEVLKDGI